MSRFIVVVVVILVIAFLANKFLLGDGDAPPSEATGAPESKVSTVATDHGNKPTSRGGSASKIADNVAGNFADDQNAAGDDADAESAEQAAVAIASDKDPAASAPSAATGQQPAGDGSKAFAPPATEIAMMGDKQLLDGIPGEGDLTLADIERWLADPKNHVVLKPELPLGLAVGAAAIQGVDENPLTRAKIELGRQLYFDPRLSADKSISCASCHDPDHGYAFDSPFGIGIRAQEGTRNSPVAYNRILSGPQFWDGRAESLEAQAVGPMANAIEMGNTHEAVVAELKAVPGYVKQFDAIFDDGVTIENAGKALASFERVIVTGPTPWDLYQELKTFQQGYQIEEEFLDELEEDEPDVFEQYAELKDASEANSITESAIRGGELFFSDKAGCTACHVGANFTDEKYHNLGVGMDAEEPDLGRFVVTDKEEDRGAFKTPTVRNAALTPPYMHDGSQATLEEVVEWYAKGGHPNEWLSKDIRKLDLTDQDKKDLVEFMVQGLAGSLPEVETGRLPPDAS